MNNKNNKQNEVGAPSNGMKYKILSHTADLRLEVYGKTMEELFTNAAEALARVLVPEVKEKISTGLKEKLEIESININILLVDFLNEILAKSQIEKAVFFLEKIKITGNKLTAELTGIRVDKFEEDVKAVTYHEVNIKKEDEIFRTKLIMDI